MRRKLRNALALAALVTGGTVAVMHAQGSLLPGGALSPLPAALGAAIERRDSAAVAAAARTRCRLMLGQGRRECFEDFLLQLVQRDKVRLALGTLDLLGRHEAAIDGRGHDYSHVIGINAWTPDRDIGAVYLQCSELYQSGCYHGVIQAYFAYTGTDSTTLRRLCGRTPGIGDNRWLRFQCVHGVGHGLVQTYAMNLPRALAGCDQLDNAYDSQSCYGGAFMEFIVGGRGQSHHVHLPSARADSAGGGPPGTPMAGMDHGQMAHGAVARDSAPPFKVRDRSDPLYPCSVLAEKYQRQCYGMQAGLAVELVGLDFSRLAKVCDLAPEAMRPPCYQGIGTYASGVTNRDQRQGIRVCSLGTPSYRPFCIVGLVKNYIDVTSDARDGIGFCQKLGAHDLALSCWVAVGEQAAVLYDFMPRREAVCRDAPPRYVDACRYGARVAGVTRPPDLPIG